MFVMSALPEASLHFRAEVLKFKVQKFNVHKTQGTLGQVGGLKW